MQIETDLTGSLDHLERLYGAPEFRGVPGAEVSDAGLRLAGSADSPHPARNGSSAADLESWALSRLVERSRRFLLVHAAALGWKGRGVILAGAPFAGKTTLAVGLVESGLDYYSDDLAPLERRHGLLHPFRRAAGVRRSGGAREWLPLGAPDSRQVPLPCQLGWVFILDAGAQKGKGLGWSVILKEAGSPAERALRSLPEITVVERGAAGSGVRLDMAPAPTGDFAEALRRFVDDWPDEVHYLGPAPRPASAAFGEAPVLSPRSRREAALEILRHTVNRRARGGLYAQYGEHPHLKAYTEIFAALVPARCFRLRPGRPEATVAELRRMIDAG